MQSREAPERSGGAATSGLTVWGRHSPLLNKRGDNPGDDQTRATALVGLIVKQVRQGASPSELRSNPQGPSGRPNTGKPPYCDFKNRNRSHEKINETLCNNWQLCIEFGPEGHALVNICTTDTAPAVRA